MVTEVVPVTVITGYHREVITGYHRAVTFTACGYGTGCVKRHSAPLQHHAGGANLSSSALARNTATKHQGNVLSARRSLPRGKYLSVYMRHGEYFPLCGGAPKPVVMLQHSHTCVYIALRRPPEAGCAVCRCARGCRGGDTRERLAGPRPARSTPRTADGASGHRGPVRPLPHSGARARHGRGARSRRTNSHTAEIEHADYKAVLRDNRSQKRDHTSTHLCINVSRPQRAVIAASQASTATRRVQLQDVPTGRALTV